jgi:hypothetical protein
MRIVREGKGRLFRRKDGKFLLYIPLDLAQDSMFPFQEFKKTKRGTEVAFVKVAFEIGKRALTVEKWDEKATRS